MLRREPVPSQKPPVLQDSSAVASVMRNSRSGAGGVANVHAPVRRSGQVSESDGVGLQSLI